MRSESASLKEVVADLILAGDLGTRMLVIRSELAAATLPRATIVESSKGTQVQLGENYQCAGSFSDPF